jgi:PAS domain S-box-containing protein
MKTSQKLHKPPSSNPFLNKSASGSALSDFILICLFTFVIFLLSAVLGISETFFDILGFHYQTDLLYIDDLIFPTLPAFCLSLVWYAWKRYKSIEQSDISLELFRRLIDQTADFIFVVDLQTSQILDVNEAVCSHLNYSKKTLLQKQIIDIDSTLDSLDKWKKYVKKIKKNKNRFTEETQKKQKGGGILLLEENIKIVKEAQNEYVIIFAKDISPRKQSSEKLLESYKHVGIVNRKVEVLSNLIKFKLRNYQKTIQHILTTALRFSQREYGIFYAYQKNRTFFLLDQRGFVEKSVSKIQKLNSQNSILVRKLLRTKKIVFENQQRENNLMIENKIISVLALPLLSHGKIIGMIILGSKEKKNIRDDALHFYDVFAVQASRMYARILEKNKVLTKNHEFLQSSRHDQSD